MATGWPVAETSASGRTGNSGAFKPSTRG
jgi:hypothetical protein